MITILLPCLCTTAEEAKLRAAGYSPVLRWVYTPSRSDDALKTIDALTLLERGRKEGSHGQRQEGKEKRKAR